jgi:putative ABC transport system substrate-binding protein
VDRRAFIGTLAGGLLAAPLAAGAQESGKVYRIASISAQMSTTPQGQGPFYDRMRELGWVHGQNFIVERRAYGDQIERIPDLAAELMRSGVDVFIVGGSIEARPVQHVTRTIPIVAGGAGDLVQGGLAASLAKPGGNVTGVQTLMPEVTGKQLALLKEVIPGLSRSGILMHVPTTGEFVRAAETSGKALGIRLQILEAPRGEDLDKAFAAFRNEHAQGIIVLRSPFIINHQTTITALALKHRIPTISDLVGFVRDGGLMSYGFDGREASRLLAETINQILRGAKASEVPIRQVTTFHLSINLKTAKALGLTIPPSLLQRADQMIE